MRALQRITIGLFILMVAAFAVSRYLKYLSTDETLPTISADSEVIYASVAATDGELSAGLLAYDAADGDITDSIVVERTSKFLTKVECKITYAVSDRNNHVAKYSRRLVYTDYESPEIFITTNLQFSVGSSVPILNYISATDVLDGSISNKAKVIDSNITPSVVGMYSVTVQASNSKGDVSYLTFPVEIVSSVSLVPHISLTAYTAYIKVGEELEPKDFIKYVVDADKLNYLDSSKIEIQSELDNKTAGTYIITYTISDKYMRKGTARLVVVVEEP